MNLVALLADRARIHPERPALIDRGRSVSFGELHRRVATGAAELHRLGLSRGDTILVFQPVSIELYELLLAAFHDGLRIMLADPSAGPAFLAQCCRRLPPDAFFGPWKAQLLRLALRPLRRIPLAISSSGFFPGTRTWNPPHATRPIEDVPGEEPALITFTSGSTGIPKAAVRTHGFLLAQHRTLSRALHFEEDETDLITLPVFVLANLASGLTSVLADTDLRAPGKADAAAIFRQSTCHRATRCAASPAFFEALLKHPGGLPPFAKIFTGGAPVFPDLLARLRAALPDAAVTAVYGSTEAEPMAHLDARDYDDTLLARTAAGQGLCAGTPVPEIDLRILRDHGGTPLPRLAPADFEALLLPPGEAGEIVVAGDHVLKGYLDGIGDEETKIHVGDTTWHRTGDAGWIDEAGRLWLLGRCSAKLPPISSAPPGAPDYPFAIECALRTRHPAFRTAAIGWRGKRTLVIGGEPEAAELAEMQARASALGIEDLRIVRELPLDRRHNAKIDYPALRALLESQQRE